MRIVGALDPRSTPPQFPLLTPYPYSSLPELTHSEFREGYRQGAIRVQVDRALAAKYLSSRLWLPVVVTPVIGVGAALALWSWVWQGLTLVALGVLLPQLVRASAPYFVLTQALEDETVYQEVFSGHIFSVTPAAAEEREKV